MEQRFGDDIVGEVSWNQVARSRAIRRILERRIAKWVEIRRRGRDDRARYRAYLQREGDGHRVYCEIQVVSASGFWQGARIGRGIQQALEECLAHMSLVSPQPQVARA